MRVVCMLELCCVLFLGLVASSRAGAVGYDDGERLHKYAEENDEKAVLELLRRGVDPGIPEEEHGRAPIHRAAKAGHLGVVELLLQYGADVNARAKSESTALHYSSNMGHVDLTTLLLDRGADLEARNEFGRTALQYAANFKHLAVVELLLDRGADINARDKSGRSALHYAVSVSHADTVKLLLDRGIARDSRNQRGETALDLADNDDIRLLLQSHYPPSEL